MISFLEGKIEYLGDKYAIISTGPIGYKVGMVPRLLNSLSKSQGPVNLSASSGQVPSASSGQVPSASSGQGENIRLFIHSQLNMREGTFDLYGFDKREDLELFNLLITVSGIGPKGAMNIMASVEPKHLKVAVVNEDANYLRKVSGLGPKTAQRIIIDLKNKLDYLQVGDGKDIDLTLEGQAMEALVSLGYSMNQAQEALRDVPIDVKTLQGRVREALKILGKK